MNSGEKIHPDRVRYLAFEGGGGRGIVYQGVVTALQHIFDQSYDPSSESEAEIRNQAEGRLLREVEVTGAKRVFYPSMKLERRQLKGVAGTSAGAITAFCLAIGMSSEDISVEAARIEPLRLGAINPQGSYDKLHKAIGDKILQQGSIYETFFEDPRNGEFCKVEPDGRDGYHPRQLTILQGFVKIAKADPKLIFPIIARVLSLLPKFFYESKKYFIYAN